MNKIFEFTDRDTIYHKCIYASIAHAIMVGKYTLLISEISWDNENILFQNMEGIRGVISFTDNKIVCGMQNEETSIIGEKTVETNLLFDAKADIVQIAREEIFPYLLMKMDDENVPAITTMFWEENGNIYSDLNEKDMMRKSNNILLPYLYEEDDMKRFWINYYEMNSEQENLVDELYQLKKTNRTYILDTARKDKISNWFGDNIIYCKQSMEEIGILFD